jgi:hypothetical protein
MNCIGGIERGLGVAVASSLALAGIVCFLVTAFIAKYALELATTTFTTGAVKFWSLNTLSGTLRQASVEFPLATVGCFVGEIFENTWPRGDSPRGTR